MGILASWVFPYPRIFTKGAAAEQWVPDPNYARQGWYRRTFFSSQQA